MSIDLYFYNNSFGGKALIPAEEFPLWIKRAEGELRIIAGDFPKDDENVKFCILEIAELLYKNNMADGILSENNDGYSVSYEKRNVRNQILHTAKCYLQGTGILYRGVFDEA